MIQVKFIPQGMYVTVKVTVHVISRGPVALQIQIKTSKLRLPISEKDNHAVSCPL